jgi:phage shock protein PspC (stress-responsive transcriptional regulator)
MKDMSHRLVKIKKNGMILGTFLLIANLWIIFSGFYEGIRVTSIVGVFFIGFAYIVTVFINPLKNTNNILQELLAIFSLNTDD